MLSITDGQKRIRGIITLFLPKYKNIFVPDEYKHLDPRLYPPTLHILEKMRTVVAQDPIIRQDVITGKALKNPDVSASYIEWLQKISSSEVFNSYNENVKLDKFFYTRDDEEGYVYSGGLDKENKWVTTFYALLTFADAGYLPTLFQPPMIYFPNAGILTIDSDGNHRLLAHVLWGQTKIQSTHATIYDDSLHDPELHEALLKLETQSIFINWGILRDVSSLLKAAGQVKKVGLSASPDQLRLMKLIHSRTHSQRVEWNPIYMLNLFVEVQSIPRMMYKIYPIYLSVKDKLEELWLRLP